MAVTSSSSSSASPLSLLPISVAGSVPGLAKVPRLANWVKETCQAPGTGTVTLLGPQAGQVSFASQFNNGDVVVGVIKDQNNGSNFEVGRYIWNSSPTSSSSSSSSSPGPGVIGVAGFGTLTRTANAVIDGTFGPGVLVNFNSGIQDVYVDLPSVLPEPNNNFVNVKLFGAKGDGQAVLNDGSMIAASAVLTMGTTSPFKAGRDEGKTIAIVNGDQLGPGVNGAPMFTTILSVNSPSSVTLNASATFTIGTLDVIWGTDDTLAIQAAIDALRITGGTCFIPRGKYLITDSLRLRPINASTDYQSISIVGEGRGTNAAKSATNSPSTKISWASANSLAMVQTGDLPFALTGAFGVGAFRCQDIEFQGNGSAINGFQCDRLVSSVLRNLSIVQLSKTGYLPVTTQTSTVASPVDTPTVNTTGGGAAGSTGGLAAGNYRLQYALIDKTGLSLVSPESADFNVPQMATPAAPTATASGTGGTIPAGTYLVSVSANNNSGETTNSPDATVVVAAGQNIVIGLPPPPVGAQGFNIFCSTANGARSTETQQNPVLATGATFTLKSLLAYGFQALAATTAGDGRIPRITTVAAPAGSAVRIYLTPPNGNSLQEYMYPATFVNSSTYDLITPNCYNGSTCGWATPVQSMPIMSSALQLHTTNDGRANSDSWKNQIEEVESSATAIAIRFTGDRNGNLSNVCHNTFIRCDSSYNGYAAYLFEATDNSTFLGTYSSRGVAAVGFGVWMMPYARSCHFYHLESSLGGLFADSPYVASAANQVWGYDRGNSEPAPTLYLATGTAPTLVASSGGSLTPATQYFYKVEAINAWGTRITQSAEASITPGGSNGTVTVTITAITGASAYKIWRGTATNAENVYYFQAAPGPFVDTGAAGNTGVTIEATRGANLSYSEMGVAGQVFSFGSQALVLAKPSTTKAPFNMTRGTAPTSPVIGDLWNDQTQFAWLTRLHATTQSIATTLFTATASVSSTLTAETKSLVGTGIGTMTAPANFAAIGKTLRIKALGVLTTGGTAGTITWQLKFGATVIASTGAIAPTISLSNVYWEMEADITFRTIGASGTVFVQGKWSMMDAATAATTAMTTWPIRGNSADPPAIVTVDTTAISLVDFQSITSNALHTLTCNQVTLEVKN